MSVKFEFVPIVSVRGLHYIDNREGLTCCLYVHDGAYVANLDAIYHREWGIWKCLLI